MSDELKQLLGDDLFKQVSEKIGDAKLIIDDGKFIRNENNEYIPRTVLDEQKKKLKEQVDSLTQQVDDLKPFAVDNEKLKEQITNLSDNLKNVQSESDKRVFEIEQSSKVRESLLKDGANPDYIDYLISKVDMNAVQKTDTGWAGLDQVKAVKEKQKLFFGTQKVSGEPPKEGDPPQPTTDFQKKYKDAVDNFGPSSAQAISVKNEAFLKGETVNG